MFGCKAKDELEVGLDVEAVFVGRGDDLNVLKENWSSHRVFAVFGIRSVGKSRLCNEFIHRNKDVGHEVIHLDSRWLPDVTALYTNICIRLGLEPNSDTIKNGRWIQSIVGVIKANENRHFIFYFDNTEEYQDNNARMRDEFLSLCTNLVRQCRNLKIIITSTTKVQFAQLRKTCFSLELLPLKDTESLELLRSELQGSGIVLGEYADTIVKLSEGLPLLILMVASELREDGGMLTPKDMVELLASCRLKILSREFYPEEDRVADVYNKFIERLSAVYRRRLAVLEYIPGSFTAGQAQHMLDFPTEALTKDQALIPVRRRHYLNYDPVSRRFDIQGILRECIQTFVAIRNIPEIRSRYVRTFVEVMSGISEKLGTENYTKAIAELSEEQPNLQKLLTEVKYTHQDNYTFFIKMATDCTELIEKFMSGDGEVFYEGCLRAASMYGQNSDMAAVNIAVGSLYTNTKSNLIQGANKYKAALDVISGHGKSLQLATVYQRLGWNLLLQGKCVDAVEYFKKSLDISMTSGEEFQLMALASLSSMGVTLTVLGRFQDAERYHFVTLKRRKQIQGENHPSIGSTLNNIGLMYDQKGDSQLALKYFIEGLEMKKRNKAPDMALLMSLNNVANIYLSLDKTTEAHAVLDEVEEVLNRQRVIPGDPVAYMYDNRGQVYMKEGKLDKAREMIEKAVVKRRSIAKENPQHLESLVNLVKVTKVQKDYETCIRTAEKVLKAQGKLQHSMPQTLMIKKCLECLADVYEEVGDDMQYKGTLGKIESELLRLEKVFMCECNETKVAKVHGQLEQIKAKLIDLARNGS